MRLILVCSTKVELFIIDHVHLTVHKGTWNADIDEICWLYIFKVIELGFMWWQLVIDYPHKTSDSCSSQKLHLVWVFSVIVVPFHWQFFGTKWTNIVTDDGWIHPLAKTMPSLVNNLWWNIVMDVWSLDDESLGDRQCLQHYKSITPQKLQGMTNNVKLTFSGGDTIPRFTVNIEQDN